MEKIRLFCLPYAGGSALVYNKWKKYMDESIEIVPLELAGRGSRFKEPLCNDYRECVEDLFQTIKDLLQEPYAFFGHSMGSLLTVLLNFKIYEAGYRKPEYLFVSGRRPPHIHGDDTIYSKLSPDEFKEEVIKLGGATEEFFSNEDLTHIFLPILKSDFEMVEEYRYEENNMILDCDISVFYGSEDDRSIEDNITQWQKYSSRPIQYYKMKGGHFFLFEQEEEIGNIISQSLRKQKGDGQ